MARPEEIAGLVAFLAGDAIIVGSGAGGGTIARHRAPSGKNLLILKRGDWLKREAENWDAAAVFEHNRYVSPDVWCDREGRPFQPQVHHFGGGAIKPTRPARLSPRSWQKLPASGRLSGATSLGPCPA